MKRFFKKFGKIAGYALVYVIITLGTAVGVIFLSSPGSKKGPGSDELYIAPQLSHIYENFTMVKALKINLDAAIETPTDVINLSLAADLDMGEGLSSIEAEGSILLFLNDETLQIDFTFADMNLYLEMLNGKFVVETNNLGDSLGSLMSILNVEIPDLGFDMGSLDVDMILSMLSNLEEVKSEDRITLNISVPVIGNLQLICDLKYNIKSFNLPKTEISEGTTIEVQSELDYPEEIIVDSPTEPGYINATHLFGVAESVLGYLNKDEIGFDIDVSYNDFNIKGNLSANLNEFASKITLDVLDRPLNLIAQDNVIYLEYGNINFKFALANSNLVTDLISKHFGVEIPLNEVISILTSLKAGNFMEIVGGLNLGSGQPSTKLSDIDLSIIERFEKINSTYYLTIRGIGELEIGVYEKELSSLSFVGFGANANLRMTQPSSLDLAYAKEAYLDVAEFIPVLDAAIETTKYDNFAGKVDLSIGEEKLELTLLLSKDNGLKVHAETAFMGQNIVVDIVNSTLYLQVSDIKLSATLEDVEAIKDFLKNVVGFTMPEQDMNDLIEQLKQIIDPTINPKLFKSVVKLDNTLAITLFNDMTIGVQYDKTINGFMAKYNDIQVVAQITATDTALPMPEITTEDYAPVTDLLGKASALLDYLKGGTYYGEIYLDYQDYNIQGVINYDANELSAALTASVQGIDIEIKFIDNIVYLAIADIRIKFALSDIETVLEFINNNFGIDLSTTINDLIENLKNSSNNKTFDIKELIENLYISYVNNNLIVRIPELSAAINFNGNELASIQIAVNEPKLSATVNILSAVSPIIINGQYMNVTDLLPIIEAVKNTIETKQFNIVADAQVYEKKETIFETKDAQLQIDLTDGLSFYGNVDVIGKTNHALELSLYEDYLYANYNGLLLKINSTDLQELLVIVMQMFGIDTSFIPSFAGATDGIDLDMDSISGFATKLLPNLDMSNPLSLVKLIKSISTNNGTLEIVINGSMISTNERAENMTIQIVTNGNKLTGLKLINFYTGVSNEEHFNLDIRFEEFAGVTTPNTSMNYVDISGSNEIIKAALNMVTYRDFELAGNLNIDMSIPVLSNLHIEIPLNVKAKIVDGKPEVFIAIEKIPVVHPLVYNLNNDTNWGYNKVNTLNVATMKSSGETRCLYIHYKDGEVYFYRTEKNTSGETYEKKLKAPMETVMSDILYYVQWGTGFNDTIINAIRESMAKEHTIDLGNIIRSFTSTNDGCQIVLNMTEISGDKNMGDMTLSLGLIDHTSTIDGQTSTKKVIGLVGFKMNMPFTDSIQLDMQTPQDNPLKLVNFGKPVDFTNFYQFVNNYEYADNIEMEAYGGNWEKASEREFTVKFVTNSPNTEADIVGVQGTTFALPYYPNYQASTATEYDLYEFAGWYTTSNFTPGTEYTEGVISRGNLTLYAKWNSLESSRTVTYYDYYGKLISSQYAQVGTKLNGTAAEFVYEKIGDKLYTKKFTGWADEDGFKLTVVPEDSTALYAQYEVVRTQTEYTLFVNTGVAPEQSPILVLDGEDATKSLPNYSVDLTIGEKIYQFADWYLDEDFTTLFDGIMPQHDLTVYAKWIEVEGSVLRIIDNGVEVCNKTIVAGMQVNLPNSVKVNSDTKWYLDQEFTQATTLPEVMGEEDLTLYIRNKYTANYTYYVNENGVHTQKNGSVSLYQGETFTLPQQNAYEINYDLDRNGEKDKLIAYLFNGYDYNGTTVSGTIAMTNSDMDLTSKLTTKEANWCKVNFVVEWAVPSGTIASWWKQKQAPTQIAPVFVLEDSSITGVTLSYRDSLIDESIKTKDMNTTCKYSYAATYSYHAVNYNTTGCHNYGTGSGKASTTAINSNITLYVEWDD